MFKRIKYINFLWVFLLALFFSGCYTQIAWRDTYYQRDRDYSYNSDNYYEDTLAYDEENYDDYYYQPYQRRGYKYYYPSISISIGSTYFYDPWYFNSWYSPWDVCCFSCWPFTCRPLFYSYWNYYSPWYFWYDYPYYYNYYNYYNPWTGVNYTGNIKFRTNSNTRLRNNDGDRGGIIPGIGNSTIERDLNLRGALRDDRSRNTDPSNRSLRDRKEVRSRDNTDIRENTRNYDSRDTRRRINTDPSTSTRKNDVREENIKRNDRSEENTRIYREKPKDSQENREKYRIDKEQNPPPKRYDYPTERKEIKNDPPPRINVPRETAPPVRESTPPPSRDSRDGNSGTRDNNSGDGNRSRTR